MEGRKGGREKRGEDEVEEETSDERRGSREDDGEGEKQTERERRGMTSKGERCSRDAARVTERGNRCVGETLVGILGTNQ